MDRPRRSWPSWLLALALAGSSALVLPSAAHATGGEGGGDSTLVVLALIMTVAVAYLLTHFVVELGMDTFMFWPTNAPLRQIEIFASEVAPAVREAVARIRGAS